MENDEKEKKNIQQDMEKHGFPLEIETSEILEAHGWETTNQASFLDSESGKSRTIDIIAEKNVVLSSELVFDIWLCVECKKTSKPWVFFTRDLDLTNEAVRRIIVSSTQFSVMQSPKKTKRFVGLMNVIIEKFFLHAFYPQAIFRKFAFNSFEPFTEGKHLSIHKTRMQVCNTVLDLEKTMQTEIFSPDKTPVFLFYIPIIVVDGRLYAYERSQLSQVGGLHYRISYHQSSFIAEVVTATSFEKYLNNLEQLMTSFKTQVGQIT